jgi:ribosomal protein S18 acetylase RimI-like enzyme
LHVTLRLDLDQRHGEPARLNEHCRDNKYVAFDRAGMTVTVDKRQEENVHAYARSWREIEEIAVRVEYRRRGAASALFRHVEVATRAGGISVVELNTWTFNDAARRSFERLGFVPKNIRYERRTQRS